MRRLDIGLVYDLKEEYLAEGFSAEQVAEFDSLETIEGIESSLLRLGHKVDRIGRLDGLVKRLAAGDRWDLAFNIAEGLRGPTRESQVPALLEAYDIPVTFGDSLCLALCLHKGFCKHVVKSHHIPTAPFVTIEDPDHRFEAIDLQYPLFAKPVAEGTGKGVTPAGKVGNAAQLRDVCRGLLQRYRQPVIVEEFLPGREFTIGIVGTGKNARVIGAMEVLLGDNADPELYTYDNKDKYENRVSYRLADLGAREWEAADIALDSYRTLGCRDAGRVDIRCDAHGLPMFMEINPLAGLNHIHSDLPILCRLLHISFDTLMSDIIASAAERIPDSGV